MQPSAAEQEQPADQRRPRAKTPRYRRDWEDADPPQPESEVSVALAPQQRLAYLPAKPLDLGSVGARDRSTDRPFLPPRPGPSATPAHRPEGRPLCATPPHAAAGRRRRAVAGRRRRAEGSHKAGGPLGGGRALRWAPGGAAKKGGQCCGLWLQQSRGPAVSLASRQASVAVPMPRRLRSRAAAGLHLPNRAGTAESSLSGGVGRPAAPARQPKAACGERQPPRRQPPRRRRASLSRRGALPCPCCCRRSTPTLPADPAFCSLRGRCHPAALGTSSSPIPPTYSRPRAACSHPPQSATTAARGPHSFRTSPSLPGRVCGTADSRGAE
mmetsp:Transcript_140425/g.365108  ORF Transcript_140425/g.365108 Transcript_140425/m.365108 type:complete len:327 (-) Transcript_140425:974-1954(-)